MKYLLVLIVVAVGAAWWRSQQAPSVRSKPAPRRATPENMVACAHCRVHLPRSEALVQEGKFYCSTAHLPRPAPAPARPR